MITHLDTQVIGYILRNKTHLISINFLPLQDEVKQLKETFILQSQADDAADAPTTDGPAAAAVGAKETDADSNKKEVGSKKVSINLPDVAS